MPRPLGTPTWLNLASTDMLAARTFYEGLFGWIFVPAEDAVPGFSTITHRDGLIGGAMDLARMECPNGEVLTSGWDVYLAADDVDAVVAAATRHGGRVLMAPEAAAGNGHFAAVVDATGAPVGVWQADAVEGFVEVGHEPAPGLPIWFELLAQDYDAALAFYRDVFDFDHVPMDMPAEDGRPAFRYTTNGAGWDATSGIWDVRGILPAEGGSRWRFYVTVDSCDAACERVRELGGRVVDEPADSPYGRIAGVADPAGATLVLCAPSEAVTEGAGIDTDRTDATS